MKLAQYFCEDESKFKVEECIGIFNTLCQKVADATKVGKWFCFIMFTGLCAATSAELILKSCLSFAGQRGEKEARGAEATHGG